MTEKDCRLTNQMDYLYEKHLIKSKYQPYRQGWEHDHCVFCSEKIDSKTPEAYCTEDKYFWICVDCYEDFKDKFKWMVTK